MRVLSIDFSSECFDGSECRGQGCPYRLLRSELHGRSFGGGRSRVENPYFEAGETKCQRKPRICLSANLLIQADPTKNIRSDRKGQIEPVIRPRT